jgi:hypothetical protein
MTKRQSIEPRGLSADQAAAYVGVGKGKFLEEVREGIWPPVTNAKAG